MKTVWRIADVDLSEADHLAEKLGIHLVVARLLCARGLVSDESVDKLFKDDFRSISSPFLIDQMSEAVDLVIKTIKSGKQIVVFGDYDVDGTSATSILLRVLGKLCLKLDFYIPHRLDLGYGLSAGNAEKLVEDFPDVDLVITVDCGITSFEGVDYLRQHDKKVIITDHHLLSGHLPDANFIVNPKLKPNTPYENLCAAAVAFKLAWGVVERISYPDSMPIELTEELKNVLPLVAMATVADVMPLNEENRLFVAKGLSMIRSGESTPGVEALLNICGVNKSRITASDISFRLAPRLNAAGRMADASVVIKLQTADSITDADYYARLLDSLNKKRRKCCEIVSEEATAQFKEESDYDTTAAIVLADSSWHKGVIGVVSARLCEIYSRPVVVFGLDFNGVWSGSARSNNGVDLKQILDNCSFLLERYGGHKCAVGLSVKQENLEKFKKRFKQEVLRSSGYSVPQHDVLIDCEVEHFYLERPLAEDIATLEPFGAGNPKPLLLTRRISVESIRCVGIENRHLKFHLVTDYGSSVEAVGFNLGKRYNEVKDAKMIDIVFFPNINTRRGKKTFELIIEDFRLSFGA
jgi:single-stranded-DNA-specific exonuclease